MLKREGELDLNSVQAYTGSLNDMLKKTMLGQEVLFKKQVHELHHLYKIQKTLMETVGGKEVGRYSFIKASAESTLLPFRNSTIDEPMDLLDGCNRVYDTIQPRTPDLKLRSDQRITHMDPRQLKLSLSIQEDNRREGGSNRTLFDVETNSCSQNVIDLEESIEKTSVQDLEISPSDGSVTPIKNFGGKYDSSGGKKNVVFHSADSNPFNQGLQKCFGSISVNNSSTRSQQVSSYEAGLLDLNKLQDDDSSCLSNDHTVPHPSTASSSRAVHGLLGKVEGTACFETGNSHSAASQGNCVNHKGQDPMFSDSNQSQNTEQDEHGNISSASSMPDCIGDNDSSARKTQQSEVKLGNSKPYSSDKFSGIHVGSSVSETLMGEQRFCDSSELKHKYLNKEVESAELDILVSEAAEALVGISLGSSVCDQGGASKVGRSSKTETKESEQPRDSSDFFELMTLMLRESSVDEYSVSPKASQVIYTDSADFGIKLRRGRRMKDFQKDILPGLSTLSRHEIREDINIMETVLRSREYKKFRGKMADGHSWCTPVKNKRSRLNSVPRRRKTS